MSCKEGERRKLTIFFVFNVKIMTHSPFTLDISGIHIEEDNPIFILDRSIKIAKEMLAIKRNKGKDKLDVDVVILLVTTFTCR